MELNAEKPWKKIHSEVAKVDKDIILKVLQVQNSPINNLVLVGKMYF